jgi:hypothetical protein
VGHGADARVQRDHLLVKLLQPLAEVCHHRVQRLDLILWTLQAQLFDNWTCPRQAFDRLHHGAQADRT